MIQLRLKLNYSSFSLSVDALLPPHGISCLFGPSGSGKTTLLRAIAGLTPATGYLQINDHIWQNERHIIPTHQRSIGYVFQEPSLFPHLSVRQNIEFGLKRTTGCTHIASLQTLFELLNITDLMERRAHQLSLGQAQRVAIARALAIRPALLLLDEPLAALDETHKQELLPYFKSLEKTLGIPMLYVSHSSDEVAQLADYLVLMRSGEITAHGQPDLLFSDLNLPLAHEHNARSLINARVSHYDQQFDLSYLNFSSGQLCVAGQLPVGSDTRLQILARDVSITRQVQAQTSILNIFPVIIEQIAEHSSASVTLRLRLDQHVLLARLTRKSVAQLELAVGQLAYAQVKSIAVISTPS